MKQTDELLNKRCNDQMVELYPNSAQFELNELSEATEHASYTRSYVSRMYNRYGEWIGYFIPA